MLYQMSFLHMSTYTPFDKELENLDENELQKLVDRSISEGWYIEYKADIPRKTSKIEGAKIVKAISAFANTKGGWLFYGVQSNDKNIATDLCGIDINEYENLPDQISQIISANINPKPVYHFKIVPLQTGRYVFIIRINESPTPPYITSAGVIYQRENNESNPIKDRYILEKLAEKTSDYYEVIEHFCQMEYVQTKGQAELHQSYLELYLFPLPFNSFFFKDFYTSEFFKKVQSRFYQSTECIFQDENTQGMALPLGLGFNSIYSSERSLIIRPLTDETLIYRTPTAELFANGGLKCFIPLREFDINNVPKHYESSALIDYLRNKYSPYEMIPGGGSYSWRYTPSGLSDLPDIKRRKETDFVRHIRMIDGVELIYILLIILTKYKAIMEDAGFDLETAVGYRARLTNTWRKFVFFDNDDYLEKIKLYNVPIAPKDDIEVPRFAKGNYYTVDLNDRAPFFSVAMTILDAIGLPDSSTIKFADIITEGIKNFDVTHGAQ